MVSVPHHPRRGTPHHGGHADGDHRRLPEVQHRQRLDGLDLGVLQVAQVVVVPARLVGLVVEVLDGLVVQQRIDRAFVRACIGFDRCPIVAGPPFGDADRPRRVCRERRQRDEGESPVVGPHQHAGHQHDLERDRNDREQRPVQQLGNRTAAALDVACHAAGAPGEMEPQAQRMQMTEHAQGDLPRSAGHHAGEHHLPKFGEQRDTDA